MADGLQINEGAGARVLTDEVNSVDGVAVSPNQHAQRVKVGHGVDASFETIRPASPLEVRLYDGAGNALAVAAGQKLATEMSSGQLPASLFAGALAVSDNGGSLTVDGSVTADTELPAAAALSDALANPTTPLAGSAGMLFNGLTWERLRGNVQVALWNGTGADGARTSNLSSANQTNYGAKGIFVHLNVTAVPGSDSLKMQVGTRGAYGAGFVLWESASFTTAGKRGYIIYPGCDTTFAAQETSEVESLALPRTFTVNVMHAGTGAFTYDLSYTLIL